MSGNPIKYYRHIAGPHRKIVREVWDSAGVAFSLLECGHAVPSRYKKGALMSPARNCMLCNKHRPSDEQIEEWGFLEAEVVKAALTEGKRRRVVHYFKERGLEVPWKFRQSRCRIAMYESPDKVLPNA